MFLLIDSQSWDLASQLSKFVLQKYNRMQSDYLTCMFSLMCSCVICISSNRQHLSNDDCSDDKRVDR